MRRALVALAAAGLLGACAPELPPEEAHLELGVGSWRFEEITDGDHAPLIRGAQGGWHFWVAARATGMAQDEDFPMLTLELQLADESRAPERLELPVSLEPADEEGRRLAIGVTAIVADPGCVVGQLLRVRASMTAADGTVMTDERYLTIDAGADPPPACGELIPVPG